MVVCRTDCGEIRRAQARLGAVRLIRRDATETRPPGRGGGRRGASAGVALLAARRRWRARRRELPERGRPSVRAPLAGSGVGSGADRTVIHGTQELARARPHLAPRREGARREKEGFWSHVRPAAMHADPLGKQSADARHGQHVADHLEPWRRSALAFSHASNNPHAACNDSLALTGRSRTGPTVEQCHAPHHLQACLEDIKWALEAVVCSTPARVARPAARECESTGTTSHRAAPSSTV